jgi:hypothetical protein
MDRLEVAATTSAEMAELLSLASSERATDNEERVIRDKAFTLLKEAVDQIRTCGQYVFWRDAQRFKGYVSTYNKRFNQNRSAADENIPEIEEECCSTFPCCFLPVCY